MEYDLVLLDKGATAPPARLRDLSGSTMSRSSFIWLPRPLHTGQAPKGLLKENIRGVISGRLMPQSSQAKFWLNISSSPSTICT